MIQEECFFRNHFWIEKKKRYESLVEDSLGNLSVDVEWTDEFLRLTFVEHSDIPFHVAWPDYQKKDALVLFLNTRPSLQSRTFTRYCHAFLFLPEAIEGVNFKEITRFSGYETRPLLKDNSFPFAKEECKNKREYQLKIPLESLWGFDHDVDQVSFAFTYYSEKNEPIHFPVPKIAPERIPYVWPICHLVR